MSDSSESFSVSTTAVARAHRVGRQAGGDGRRIRPLLGALAVGLVANFAWGMAQAVLYEPMGTVWQATWRCFVASLADAAMALALVGVGWAVCRRAGSRARLCRGPRPERRRE